MDELERAADLCTKHLLDSLLISTLSDDPDVREWAVEHLYEYAKIIKRQRAVEGLEYPRGEDG